MVQADSIKEKINQYEVEFQYFVNEFHLKITISKDEEWNRDLQSLINEQVSHIKSLIMNQNFSIDQLIKQFDIRQDAMFDAMARIETIYTVRPKLWYQMKRANFRMYLHV